MPNLPLSYHHPPSFSSSCRLKLLNLRRYTNINRRKEILISLLARHNIHTKPSNGSNPAQGRNGVHHISEVFRISTRYRELQAKTLFFRDLLPEENFESSECGPPANIHFCWPHFLREVFSPPQAMDQCLLKPPALVFFPPIRSVPHPVQTALPLRPSLVVGLPRPTSYWIILLAHLVNRWLYVILLNTIGERNLRCYREAIPSKFHFCDLSSVYKGTFMLQ